MRHPGGVWLLRPPGVYAPQGDTRLLIEELRRGVVHPGAHVLDVCTGSGVVALEAARLGAAEVRAVDVSRRAACAARWNARLRGLPVTVHRGGLLNCAGPRRFEVVTANPPYVAGPGTGAGGGARGASLAWEAGTDGRRYLDQLCRAAPWLLADGGVMLLVHSSLCGTDRTVEMLRSGGLKAAVAARRRQPFGPVLRARARWLEERGLISPGEREEELVVIRADVVPSAA